MKSRIAMTAMLVSGLLMSGTGAGLAVSGLGQTDNASRAQYNVAPPATSTPPATPPAAPPATPPAPTPENDTLPTSTESTPTCDENADGVVSPSEALKNGCSEVAAETDSESAPQAAPSPPSTPSGETAPREEAAQPARQVEASSDELPFTGFAAVPILVGGIALLGGGLVLRRRTV